MRKFVKFDVQTNDCFKFNNVKIEKLALNYL